MDEFCVRHPDGTAAHGASRAGHRHQGGGHHAAGRLAHAEAFRDAGGDVLRAVTDTDAGPYWGHYTVSDSDSRTVIVGPAGHRHTDWLPRGDGCPIVDVGAAPDLASAVAHALAATEPAATVDLYPAPGLRYGAALRMSAGAPATADLSSVR